MLIARQQEVQALEETLRQTSERVHLANCMFDQAPEGILVTDAAGRIVDVNPAFERITGYSRDEVLGRRPCLLMSVEQDRQFYDAMWRSIRETGSWNGEVHNRRKNGEPYVEQLRLSAVRSDRGSLHYLGVFTDITDQKRHQAWLEHCAHHDGLTSLPNRARMTQRLDAMLAEAHRDGTRLHVCYLDLDGFKAVNDLHGHDAGDALLGLAAQRMRGAMRSCDVVARIGGDEFVLLVGEAEGPVDIDALLARVCAGLTTPFTLGPCSVRVGASVGVAVYPGPASTAEDLLRVADQAMYRAKRLGKNRVAFAQDGDQQVESARSEQLREALVRGELQVYYQPKIDALTGRPVGAEALVRWNHPQRGQLLPCDFLGTLEVPQLALELDLHVLRAAAAQCLRWLEKAWPLSLCVNLKDATLLSEDLAGAVAGVLHETGLAGTSALELEVSERALLRHPEAVLQTMEACTQAGAHFAVDDFGTAGSSLNLLCRLPVRTLKIDRSLVGRMLASKDAMLFVRAVVGSAQACGATTVGEGVETAAQADALRALGCSQLQGYAVAQPMTASEFERWLSQWPTAVVPGPGSAACDC